MKDLPQDAYLRRMSQQFISFIMILALVTLAACGGGGGEDPANEQDTAESEAGDLLISLTDAEGDFLSYTVDVTSLVLTRRDGTIVETVPESTRVDFAQYTELSEFFTAATVPSGVYTSGVLSIDYSEASIFVENVDGDAVEVQSLRDEEGEAIATLDVSVHLNGRNELVIAPGIPSHLMLDFDLKSSNHVEFDDEGQPIVTVEPVLLADVNIEHDKIHRIRGGLTGVDVDNQTIELLVRPFRHAMRFDGERFGELNVTVHDETQYWIDDEQYLGAEGLTLMSEQPRFTAVVAWGEIKVNPLRFIADEVHAGSSVAGGEKDIVKGNIVQRNGDIITIKGGALIRDAESMIFNESISVRLSESTTVSKQASEEEAAIIDLSIGQKVMVFGDLVDSEVPDLEMDAENGHVFMEFTTLKGTAVLNQESQSVLPLTMDLQRIDRRSIDLFDFTGTKAEGEADPHHYVIDTGDSALENIGEHTPIKVRGFPSAYGHDGEFDFTARTVVDVSARKAVLTTSWSPASADAFSIISDEKLVLNLAEDLGRFHGVNQGGVMIDLVDLDVIPEIQPEEGGEGIFMIEFNHSVQLWTTFADFSQDILSRLERGELIKGVRARGAFDEETGVMTSSRVVVKMVN